MSRKSVRILIFLLLLNMFYVIPHIHLANAAETIIYIRADGSVNPKEAPISTVDNITYILTDNIANCSVVIERNGITIDGNKHTITGTGIFGKPGINATQVNGITIKRAKISNASPAAIWLYECSNCTLQENELTGKTYGIYPNFCSNIIILRNKVMNNQGGGLYVANSFNFIIKQNLIAANPPFGIGFVGSTNSTVTKNAIANNGGPGIRVYTSTNIRLHHNDFVNNAGKAFSQSSTVIWDDGSEGNYWSDYNGTDVNQDGVGDTPYVIGSNNIDHYPLMQPLTVTLMGDVNYDGVVNILDITIIGSAYGSNQIDPNYILQADLAPPYGVINMLDAVTCAAHYAETFP